MIHTKLIRRAIFAVLLSGSVLGASTVEARPARRTTTKKKTVSRKPAPKKKAPKKVATKASTKASAKATAPRVTIHSSTSIDVADYKEQSRQRAIEWVKQAAEAFERGDYEGTITLCKTANDAYPTYSRAYTWMGAAYQKLGKTDEACSAFKWVVALSPNTPDAERAQRGMKELGCNGPVY